MQHRPPSGTVILDALDVGAQYFANHPEASDTYLIIFSDMIEESDRLDWRAIQTPEAREAFIKGETEQGTLANLDNVVVYVAGVGPNAIKDQPPARVRAWRTFWHDYIEAAGGSVEGRWSTSLSRFPPPG